MLHTFYSKLVFPPKHGTFVTKVVIWENAVLINAFYSQQLKQIQMKSSLSGEHTSMSLAPLRITIFGKVMVQNYMWIVWILPATPANPVPLTCVVIPRCFRAAPEWRRWIFWRQLAVAVEQRSASGAAWTQLDWETSQLWQRWQLAAVAGPGSSWAARNLVAPQGMNQVFELEGYLEQRIEFKNLKLNLRLKNLVCVEKNKESNL